MNIGKTIIPVRAEGASASSCSSGGCSSGCSSAGACGSDPETLLERQGWVRRTTIGEPRLSEIAENYRAMGYEVHVERWRTGAAEGSDECTTCFDAADPSGGEVWGTVYVRQAKVAASTDEIY